MSFNVSATAPRRSASQINESTLQSVLDACKARSPGGSAVIKTVVVAVTMYDKPRNGSDVCYLNPNERLTVLSGADIPQVFRNIPDKNWVAVRGNTGGCTARLVVSTTTENSNDAACRFVDCGAVQCPNRRSEKVQCGF